MWEVANLLLGCAREIGVTGAYEWNCVSTTQGNLASAILSISWTNDDKDEGKALARFLLGLEDLQVIAVVSAIRISFQNGTFWKT